MQLKFISSGLLFLLTSVSHISGQADPNRLSVYTCQRHKGPQLPTERKPHVFVYVEDRAFKNIEQQVRDRPQEYANYEITKGEVPFPIRNNNPEQQLLRVRNRDGPIPTQIPSPLECANEPDNQERDSNQEQSEIGFKPNKDSIFVQIPVNKYFDCKNAEILIRIAKKEVPAEKKSESENIQSADQGTDSNLNSNNRGVLQQLYMVPQQVRPASIRHTEIAATQDPEIVELPISYNDLNPLQLPQLAGSPPSYMLLPAEDLKPAYSTQPTISTSEDQIKSIIIPEGESRQQNTPQDTTTIGYPGVQSTLVDLNKQEEESLDFRHGNSNIPIKDINVAEFDVYGQQQKQQNEENQEAPEKVLVVPKRGVVQQKNASVESKSKSKRPCKTKCVSCKDDGRYGIILEP